RYVIVKVEIAPVGRHPLEVPAHTLLERQQLSQRRSRHGDQRDIAGVQMHDNAVEVVSLERTTLAALGPAGSEHEVIDDQLTPAVKEVSQRLSSARAVENILFLDFFPGQLATLPAQVIAEPGKFLLFFGEFLTSSNPFVVRDDFVLLNP